MCAQSTEPPRLIGEGLAQPFLGGQEIIIPVRHCDICMQNRKLKDKLCMIVVVVILVLLIIWRIYADFM